MEDLLSAMAVNRVDYTVLFRRLCHAATAPASDDGVATLFSNPEDWQGWAVRWHQRLEREELSPEQRAANMRVTNPAVIPRNHRIEEAIEQAVRDSDFSLFEQLHERLRRPYEEESGDPDLLGPPAPEEAVCQTFCGT